MSSLCFEHWGQGGCLASFEKTVKYLTPLISIMLVMLDMDDL